jgi:hypothetical protein
VNRLDRLIILLGVGSLLAALTVPFLFYVNIPCQDDWTLVPITGNILEGKAVFMDFWSFRSEHRIFFPRLILAYSAAWTHWNLNLISWLNLFLVFLGTYFIFRIARPGKQLFWKSPIFWGVSIFTFSLHAVKIVVWSIQLHTFLSLTLAIGSLFLIAQDPRSNGRWVLASLVAMVSTFSFGKGMPVWVAALPLLLGAKKGDRFLSGVIWISSAILCLTVYFWDFPYAKQHPSLPFVVQDPLYTARFFITYLGAIFYPLPAGPFGAVGLLFTVLLAIDAYRSKDDSLKGLLCVALFVLGNALTTSIGRSHYSIEAAVVDRYIPVSCYLWGVLAAWAAHRLNTGSTFSRNFFSIIPVILSVFILATTSFHWKDYEENKTFLESAKKILREEPLDMRKALTLFPEEALIKESIGIMKRHRLSIFNYP